MRFIKCISTKSLHQIPYMMSFFLTHSTSNCAILCFSALFKYLVLMDLEAILRKNLISYSRSLMLSIISAVCLESAEDIPAEHNVTANAYNAYVR